ncbi:Sin3 associated polypeptide p18-domain-containing protein [Gamsiella multidivaricata]|uniref:Sin3 associated polypeptide p18-domain-containing protein n=1 Tax=Gamsiella multidivaricata TaxID=101098 RepID=UPI00221E5755|nr:Sin3 associated polypeptide p18-domain-containing protein [Gamsiella multidivaricata]KAG0359048.1 mtDNA inheritance, partitioning of the mitochondrial organelle [Gamsiella multidivaricata]KAI7827426.1 Sin3 associated polypeptide p18-domain-containing protein [Gamsiella multidivaricata]
MTDIATAPDPAEDKAVEGPTVIDREKLCPFLLRMYYCRAQFHRVDDFSPTSTPPQSSELRLYTWKNATLGEIASLVKQAIPDLVEQAGPGGQLMFRHIYLDINKGIFVGKDIGTVSLDSPQPERVLSKSDEIPSEGLFTKDIQKTGSIAIAGAAAREIGLDSRVLRSTSTDSEKTLESFKFVIGDYLDIAITSGTTAGFVPPSRLKSSQSGGGPMRNRGRQQSGRQGGSGGGGGSRMNPLGDRLAGRLGGGFGRNGHGGFGSGGRRGDVGLDVHSEPNWKSRGRGR